MPELETRGYAGVDTTSLHLSVFPQSSSPVRKISIDTQAWQARYYFPVKDRYSEEDYGRVSAILV